MAHPSFILIKSVHCLKTDDLTGSDDLVAVLGVDRFSLGSIREEAEVAINLTLPIAPGVTQLTIVEEDLVSDDPLGTIELDVDMDIERTVAILGETARYDFVFIVTSEPDL